MQPMVFAVVVAAGEITAAGATLDRPTGTVVPYRLDTGAVANVAGVAEAGFAEVVRVEGAGWLRLHFERVDLAAGSRVRMTSLADGETQELDASAMARWGNSSAYFNGDAVLVELLAAAGTAGNRVIVDAITRPASRTRPAGGGGGCGICGTDDRVLSTEQWAARLLPAGCTASVFDETSCMVSAGHCVQGVMVVQFNVPDSNGDCSINNPPVADQFPIVDSTSVNGGAGNDWAVLVPAPNGLGELPFERYGALRPVAGDAVSAGTTAAIWGYGVDDTCTHSQVQQTAGGPVIDLDATTLYWAIDIRGGNSGSAIVHDDEIVGVVTHCAPQGCPAGSNLGTRVDLPAFAAARTAACGETLAFSFPAGLPDFVAVTGAAVPVVIDGGSGTPVQGSGAVHVSVDGGSFVSAPMSAESPGEYVAALPATECGAVVAYFFSATTTSGVQVTWPSTAPADRFVSLAADQATVRFADAFETDLGWTVSGTASDGHWQRGVPIPSTTCDRGNPGADGDGSGRCYVTDNSAANNCNSDVDGGSTVLTSPIIDAGDPSPVLEYRRWFSTTAGSGAYQDSMVIELSLDGGLSWSTLETVGPVDAEVDGGWYRRVWRPAQPTELLRVRFTVADTDPPSAVEAGVDGVLLRSLSCAPACFWDLDGSGVVGIEDLLGILAAWGTTVAGPPDFDGDGVVGIGDFLELIANWGPCQLATAGSASFSLPSAVTWSSWTDTWRETPRSCMVTP